MNSVSAAAPAAEYALGDDSPSFAERWAVVRRRARLITAVGMTLLLATIATSLLWPSEYRSVARILIEDPEVPPEMVQSTIVSFGDKRIETINQRVMTSENLLALIKKYELYPAIQYSEPREELLETMRGDLDMKMLSADVVDSRSGHAMRATIAFELSYENESALKAYKVANELTTLYLNENLKNRTELAGETSAFLAAEADKLGQRLKELGGQLEAERAKNVLMLPELLQANAQMLDRTDRDIDDVIDSIKNLDERKALLEGQLAQTRPKLVSIGPDGARIGTLADAEQQLRIDEARMAAIYSEKHPDLVRTRELLAQVRAAAGDDKGDENVLRLQNELAIQERELTTLREKHSQDHPDVQILEQVIAELHNAINQQRGEAPQQTTEETARSANNPAWLQLHTQLQSMAAERAGLEQRLTELRSKTADYERRLQGTPLVEANLRDLYRDYEATQTKHTEIRNKLVEAELAEALEQSRKGERLTLLEPAVQAERPDKPNRPLLLGVGSLLSLAIALLAGFTAEALDTRVHGADAMQTLLGLSTLGSVPVIATSEDLSRQRRWRWVAMGLVMLAAAVALALVHFFVMPLDTLVFTIIRKVT